MITCRVYRDGALAEEGFDAARISDHLEAGEVVWVDVEDPAEDEIQQVREEFGLHEESLRDLHELGQRTKVDRYGEYFQVVLYAVGGKPGEVTGHEVHLYASPRFLLTFRFAPAFDMQNVLRRWNAGPTVAKFGGSGLLYVVIDEIVDTYFPLIQLFDEAAENLEDRVFAPRVEVGLQEELFLLKKDLVEFRRFVVPLRDVLDFMEEDDSIIVADAKPYFRDVYDNVYRALEFVDNSRETMTAALSAYQSSVGNQMNVIMKKLTAWAAILLVPTLIAGIYGMNFENMPELEWLFGYPWALGLMFVSSVVLYLQFRKRDWL